MRGLLLAFLLPILAAPRALADDVGPTLGKERAAASLTQWQAREVAHPKLGNVRAATSSPVEARVGEASVYTRALVSCDVGTRRMGIELTTTPVPSAMPVLLCSRPIAPWDAKLVQEELSATWEVDKESGAALARNLRPFPLRECVVIRAEQTVTLPDGKKARVDFEIHPYGRELDAVFTACGERTAYAPSEPTTVASAAAETSPPPAPKAEPAWRRARVTGTGKTNVRASPSVRSAIVAQVSARSVVMVQATDSEWFRAKAASGGGFSGYIRRDRLALE